MTVGELLNRMSTEELNYWWALNNIRAEEQQTRDLETRAQENLKKWRA